MDIYSYINNIMKPARIVGCLSGLLFIIALLIAVTQREYFYYLTPTNVHAAAGWATFAGTSATISGSFKALSFIDQDNNAYLLDPSNTGNSLLVAGSVGIGTTGPGARLSLGATGTGRQLYTYESGNTVRGFGNDLPGGIGGGYEFDMFVPSATLGKMAFGTMSDDGAFTFSPKMSILANGNVGIGTTAPAQKLEVNGNTDISGGWLAVTGTLYPRADINLFAKAGGWLSFATRNTSGSEAVYDLSNIGSLMAAGNVGIGTTDPGALLEISSTAPALKMSDTTASAKSLLVTTDANLTRFSEAAGTNIMTIDLTNSRVGIGTTAPLKIFDVATSTAADGFRSVNSSAIGANSGGYVFVDAAGTPTASGNRLGAISFRAITTGTTYNSTSGIVSLATQAWSGTAAGSGLYFYVTANDATSALYAGAFNQDRTFGVGVLGAAQATHVCTNSSGGYNWLDSCSASSRRYKENILDLDSSLGLKAVMNLRPVSFDYKKSYSSVPRTVGFIAEEVEKISPMLVDYKGYTDDSGKTLQLPENVKYENLTAVLAKSVQEQQAEITSLKATIDKQQQEIDELKTAVNELRQK